LNVIQAVSLLQSWSVALSANYGQLSLTIHTLTILLLLKL